jgi:hypothetical protein
MKRSVAERRNKEKVYEDEPQKPLIKNFSADKTDIVVLFQKNWKKVLLDIKNLLDLLFHQRPRDYPPQNYFRKGPQVILHELAAQDYFGFPVVSL